MSASQVYFWAGNAFAIPAAIFLGYGVFASFLNLEKIADSKVGEVVGMCALIIFLFSLAVGLLAWFGVTWAVLFGLEHLHFPWHVYYGGGTLIVLGIAIDRVQDSGGDAIRLGHSRLWRFLKIAGWPAMDALVCAGFLVGAIGWVLVHLFS